MGTDGGGFRFYDGYYGPGGDGGRGAFGERGQAMSVFLGYGDWTTVYGGGGGGGFGGGLGGKGGIPGESLDDSAVFAGDDGMDFGGDGGEGGIALPALAGRGGGPTGVGEAAVRPDNGLNSGGNGGGGNGGNGSAGRYMSGEVGLAYGHGGGGGGGGGYGGGVLVLLAASMTYDAVNPPKLLVSGQLGGAAYAPSRNDGVAEPGQPGAGGLLIIECPDCTIGSSVWSLGQTVSIPLLAPTLNGGHGLLVGDPQRVFVNGMLTQ